MLTNDNFFKGVMGIAEQWRFTDGVGEPRHDADVPHRRLRAGRWSACTSGAGPSCSATSTRPRSSRAIPEYGITNAFIVPAVIQFLLMTPGVESTDFSTLRALVYGASPITDARAASRAWRPSAASSSRSTG